MASHNHFLRYGVGIVTYLNIIFKLLCMVAGLSLLAIIQMILYWIVDGYGNLSNDIGGYALTSFGNIGFTKAVCSKDIINMEFEHINMNFQCEKTT